MDKYKNNLAATMLFAIGVAVMLIFFIVGIVFYLNVDDYGLLFWVVGLISGMTFLGFAEIIALLQKSSDTLEQLLNQPVNKNGGEPAAKGTLKDIEANLPKI